MLTDDFSQHGTCPACRHAFADIRPATEFDGEASEDDDYEPDEEEDDGFTDEDLDDWSMGADDAGPLTDDGEEDEDEEDEDMEEGEESVESEEHGDDEESEDEDAQDQHELQVVSQPTLSIGLWMSIFGWD